MEFSIVIEYKWAYIRGLYPVEHIAVSNAGTPLVSVIPFQLYFLEFNSAPEAHCDRSYRAFLPLQDLFVLVVCFSGNSK
jgi:hypothetical protein